MSEERPSKVQQVGAAYSLIARLKQLERKYRGYIRQSKWLSRLVHSHFFSFKPHPFARGMAIGMFWACMPMPFQMAPALLFCWMGFANLPIAILCVWISNPLTYLPIFYLEYELAVLLFYPGLEMMSFSEFSAAGAANIFQSLGGIYRMIVEGALVLGVALALFGYAAGILLGNYLLYVTSRLRNKR